MPATVTQPELRPVCLCPIPVWSHTVTYQQGGVQRGGVHSANTTTAKSAETTGCDTAKKGSSRMKGGSVEGWVSDACIAKGLLLMVGVVLMMAEWIEKHKTTTVRRRLRNRRRERYTLVVKVLRCWWGGGKEWEMIEGMGKWPEEGSAHAEEQAERGGWGVGRKTKADGYMGTGVWARGTRGGGHTYCVRWKTSLEELRKTRRVGSGLGGVHTIKIVGAGPHWVLMEVQWGGRECKKLEPHVATKQMLATSQLRDTLDKADWNTEVECMGVK